MGVLGDFLSNGQDRRRWIEEKGQDAADALQYYLGPGVNVNALAQIADMFNPVADIGRAGTAARGVVRPGATAMERVNALGNVATDMASVLAPVAGAAYADDLADGGIKASRAIVEGLANWSMPADDAVGRFVLDEDGAIRAWHGSPHDFDRFSMDKIGTGEGAQTYGHGLYFAENPAVARSYQAVHAPRGEDYLPTSYLQRFSYDKDAAIGGYLDDMGMSNPAVVEWTKTNRPDDWARHQGVIDQIKSDPSRLYEVNIDANPDDFLDWDKPLSEQPQKIRDILSQHTPLQFRRPYEETDLGKDLYFKNTQGLDGGGRYATEEMQRIGIPGIRYLDAGSRGAGDGSRNYVVFDDRLVDVLGKDGARTTPQGKAQDVLDMLAAGRASEVTDDMLDLGDPVLNAQLNEYLFRNYDLPMDEASRMARAREMGFHDADVYHATPNDVQGFDLNASGMNTTIGDQERAVFLSDSGEGAASFINRGYVADFHPFDGLNTLDDARARYLEIDKAQGERAAKEWWANEVVPRSPTYQDYADGGNVIPARISTNNGFSAWDYYGRGYDSDQAVESILDAKGEGSDAVVWRNIVDGGFMGGHKKQNVVAHFDPAQIRSRFARFDPRLAHLRNLSAGVGGLGIALGLQPSEEEELRAYLQQ